MVTTPVRIARAGVVLSTLAFSGVVVALLVAAQPSDPAAVLLAAAAAAVVALASVRMASVAPRRTVTVGHRAREHAEPLSSAPAPAHPDTDGRVRSRAPGRPVAAV